MLLVAIVAGIAMMMMTFWQTKNGTNGREVGGFHVPFISTDDSEIEALL